MAFQELSEFYEELYSQTLGEPKNTGDVKNILSCIRAQNGSFDSDDESHLQAMPPTFQKKIALMSSKSRKVLAKFTKTISSQLYDDPFRFFFELIQNADDASYTKAADLPSMIFRVFSEELWIETNEDGFTLGDVLSICDTGQSSKLHDQNSTGEKGFGFKAVFGIADRVQIQSGLWSFRFEHQRHQDGMGMITPIWELPETLRDGIRTRFKLRYCTFEHDNMKMLQQLWKRLETQHASLLFALRKLKKVSIEFRNGWQRNDTICFDKSVTSGKSEGEHFVRITSANADNMRVYLYRTFTSIIKDMPRQTDHSARTASVQIGFPVTAQHNGSLDIQADGQFVFAYLPVMQLAQLPFIIQADFILPGSRQSVTDNLWNTRLRERIAYLFVISVLCMVQENDAISYEWPESIPKPTSGFWEPLQGLIHQGLSVRDLFRSRSGSLHRPDKVLILSSDFMHNQEPLIRDTAASWQFLSARYKNSLMPVLRSIGVRDLSLTDALDLMSQNITDTSSILQMRPLYDAWHTSFLRYIKLILRQNNPVYKERVSRMAILPVRVNGRLEWWRSSRNVFLPVVVDEGSAPDRIKIELPRSLDLVVLHPDAADDSLRNEVYQLLGVCQCSPATICEASNKAVQMSDSLNGPDLLTCFELLFWFSKSNSVSGSTNNMMAMNASKSYTKSKELFMLSDDPFHSECLLNLSRNTKYNKYFLDRSYQESQVSTRYRNGTTWEKWLCTVAGVRWYPSLDDPTDRNGLFWMIDTIRQENPAIFVPMIQHYWQQDYQNTCRASAEIREALRGRKVLCQSGAFERLCDTWFPSSAILTTASQYGVHDILPILKLPPITNDHLVSQWPACTELGVRSTVDMWFYREVLFLLAKNERVPSNGVTTMAMLYKNLGDLVTLENQKYVKDDFTNGRFIWRPSTLKWLKFDECVWKSQIPLVCKFVLTSEYDESAVSGLFHLHLKFADVSIDDLIDELQEENDSQATTSIDRVSAIYSLLKEMANTTEEKQELRHTFKTQNLIYIPDSGSGLWVNSSACIWHTTINIGNRVPIAATFPQLQEFFVDILRVNTVTDVFMMNELATAAAKEVKTVDEIKNLMFSTTELLDVNSASSNFEKAMKILETSSFLPYKSSSGVDLFCSPKDTFFIVDNKNYAEKFKDQLPLLDFTYEQLFSLHDLFRILRVDDRYLTRHVQHETSIETSVLDVDLTEQFRQCAYAISCCAISHRSPRFANQNKEMYDKLLCTDVHTSSNMSAELVVNLDDKPVRVEYDKALLDVKHDPSSLVITLPFSRRLRLQNMRAQLPGYLSDLLQIYDSRGERQISRIINELDSGTDEILLSEEISKVSWLAEVSRPQPNMEVVLDTSSPAQQPRFSAGPSAISPGRVRAEPPRYDRVRLEIFEFENVVPAANSITIDHSTDVNVQPPPFRVLPDTFNHAVEAPNYWKVLAHVRRQVSSIANNAQNTSNVSAEELAHYFSLLTIRNTNFDPADYPSLFGDDFWLSKFRIGAAGELFVYELLRQMTSNSLDLQHWQSGIRHLVQAHAGYSHVTRWRHRETADIVYKDNDYRLCRILQSNVIGDVFDDWLPVWIAQLLETDINEPLEWLFEVKTSIGPCETDFIMSQAQYDLMRSLNGLDLHQAPLQAESIGISDQPSQHQCRKIYCIIRIYNLLSNQIGIRFFIDPWRFRDTRLEFGTTEKWRVTPRNI